MKKVIATTMAAFLVAQVASAISASVDIASAYVFRGTTFNDGLVVQPGVEGEVAGLTVGAWANVDINDVGGDDQVSEIDLYIGKDLGSVAGWDVSAGYCEYTYPGAAGNGESELSLSASGALAGIDISVGAYSDVAESATPNYYEVSTGGSTAIAGIALDYGIASGYFIDADADEDLALETGLGYVAYSVSYDTGGGSLSATYIDNLDTDLVQDGESVVFAYGISL
ncbi:MAG: TorF family putative porin [Pontiellaceae bacterium]